MSKEKLYGCGIKIEKLLDYWRDALPSATDYAELVAAPPGRMDAPMYMMIQEGIL